MPKDTGRFAGIDREKLRIWINDNWENYGNNTFKYSPSDYANEREGNLRFCMSIFLSC